MLLTGMEGGWYEGSEHGRSTEGVFAGWKVTSSADGNVMKSEIYGDDM